MYPLLAATHAALLLLLLSTAVVAIQPSAQPAYAAPLRPLPWGQLNVLHTTDVHGWLGGHLQEASFGGDWGDYVSFAAHLRARADAEGTDLLVVDTGDRIEGNGLYDASEPKGKWYFDLFREQHVDVICSGNHELYKANSSNDELRRSVPNFRDAYVASNLDIFDPDSGERVPLAQRYRTFTTKNQGLRVLAFGFLFDFTGNANNTIVQPVEETVKEKWFVDALRSKEVDVIIVIGHVGVRMPEFKNTLFRAIRAEHWDTPIMFFGGHVHVRDFTTYDGNSAALASGRYLETVGFLSASGLGSSKKKTKPAQFARRYIDNNLFSYKHHANKTSDAAFHTPQGVNVSQAITHARKALTLNTPRGCAPQTYLVNRAPFPAPNSIFSLLADRVFPDIFSAHDRIAKEGRRALVLTNTGAVRFDIFAGAFTRDSEFLISPFTSVFRYVPAVPARVARRVLALLNRSGQLVMDVNRVRGMEEWRMAPLEQMAGGLASSSSSSSSSSGSSSSSSDSRGAADEFGSGYAAQTPLLRSQGDDDLLLHPGYTTHDDYGADGDDTVHSPVAFYAVPNAVQAAVGFENSTSWLTGGDGDDGDDDEDHGPVDLVYNEFVQPWLLLALRYLGEKTEERDTAVWEEGLTLTRVLREWVVENWKC